MAKKAILVILDGWGHSENKEHNAIFHANTPNFDRLKRNYPHTLLHCSGESVGLPDGQMGTSEVNHMTIGAGRVIFQDLVKINKAIESDELARNDAILKAMEHVKNHESTLHLKGLLSPNGVHSHQDHFYALLSLAKRIGVTKVAVHAFTDGRDTPPKSSINYMRELEDFMQKLGLGKVVSVSGRFYSMDRDNNWERTDLAYHAITKREGKKYKSSIHAIEEAYNREETDEFIEPSIIETDDERVGYVSSDDAVIFVNYRADRARQLTNKFLSSKITNLHYTTMTNYSDEFECNVAFPTNHISNTLGEIISNAGIKQLRITETEKYNHVTYFLNCKREEAFEGEDRIMLDTQSDVKTHDERPEMRAQDIANEVIQASRSSTHEVIICNICNPDMVGHTANKKATIKAIEVVDECIGKIVDAGVKHNYNVIITADHGNAEELVDSTGTPKTSHSLNSVPFILINKQNNYSITRSDRTSLIDIAPTVLNLLSLDKPQEMTGKSLINK